MKVNRVDTIDNVVYIMTENHRYSHVLEVMKKLEPSIVPIKHVNTDRSAIATGYKVSARTAVLEKLVEILKKTEV